MNVGTGWDTGSQVNELSNSLIGEREYRAHQEIPIDTGHTSLERRRFLDLLGGFAINWVICLAAQVIVVDSGASRNRWVNA